MPSLVRNFEELYGRAPEVISEAPGRVNLIGEQSITAKVLYFPLLLPIALTLQLLHEAMDWYELLPFKDVRRFLQLISKM